MTRKRGNAVRWALFAFALSIFSSTLRAGQIRELSDLKLIDRVGQSALYQTGDVRVLLLQGTPYQIGYAHGKLLAQDVAKLVNRVLLIAQARNSMDGKEFTIETMEEIYRRTLPYIPAHYREEMRGLADGAGLDFHKVELANIFPEMFHCSGYALMGKATKGGKLIHCRILDYMTEVGLQDQSMVMVVKSPGRNTIMLGTFTGFIGCVTGMNDRQIGVGQMGMAGFGHWDGMPMTCMLRTALEDYNTLADIKNFLIRTRRTCEHAFIVSDAKISSAFAMHSRWDGYEFMAPGESHPMLNTPLPDCVMVSGPGRYEELVKKVKEAYGTIDVAKAIEITKQPVAMRSNLHNAIMLPDDGIMYLANAASANQPEFQACYQPYYKHEFKHYLSMLTELARDYQPTEPAMISLTAEPQTPGKASATQPANRIQGKVPASLHRPIKPTNDPHLAELLKRFDVPAEDFAYTMDKTMENEYYTLWKVRFPSPMQTATPENNTVWCEYFQARVKGPRPAILVLHILQNDFTLPRIVCHSLAAAGMDAMLVKMAYYGERRPKEEALKKKLTQNMETLLAGVCQSVMDVRRAAEFLAAQPGVDDKKIGICGISLGALVGSLTIGVDGNFSKAAIVLGGADLAQIIHVTDQNIRDLRECLAAHNITDETQLRKVLEPIEPLTYIDRARNTGVLLINAKGDKAIPPACTKALIDHLPQARVEWFDAGHNSMIMHFVSAIESVKAFFKE